MKVEPLAFVSSAVQGVGDQFTITDKHGKIVGSSMVKQMRSRIRVESKLTESFYRLTKLLSTDKLLISNAVRFRV